MENLQQSCSNIKYFKGKIVGILELLEEDKENKRWKVKCTKCGAEFTIARSTLSKYAKGDINRCKFCPKEASSKKYPNGSVYGCIQVINYDGEKFKLKCLHCGREFEASRATLLSYAKASPEYCSYCKPEVHTSKKYQPGEIIGNCYKLVRYLGGDAWIVKCIKCGKEQEQTIPNMKKHKKDTCFYCDHPYSSKSAFGRTKNSGLSIDERIYTYYKNNIESKNLKNPTKKQKEFKLSLEEYSQLIHSPCYYCGATPTEDNVWNKSGKRKMDEAPIKINGVDRVDPNLGYTIENCVPCCPHCNIMKMDYSQEEFLNKVKQIYYKMFNDQSKDVALSNCETENA